MLGLLQSAKHHFGVSLEFAEERCERLPQLSRNVGSLPRHNAPVCFGKPRLERGIPERSTSEGAPVAYASKDLPRDTAIALTTSAIPRSSASLSGIAALPLSPQIVS
jgi:hypothetical protein